MEPESSSEDLLAYVPSSTLAYHDLTEDCATLKLASERLCAIVGAAPGNSEVVAGGSGSGSAAMLPAVSARLVTDREASGGDAGVGGRGERPRRRVGDELRRQLFERGGGGARESGDSEFAGSGGGQGGEREEHVLSDVLPMAGAARGEGPVLEMGDLDGVRRRAHATDSMESLCMSGTHETPLADEDKEAFPSRVWSRASMIRRTSHAEFEEPGAVRNYSKQETQAVIDRVNVALQNETALLRLGGETMPLLRRQERQLRFDPRAPWRQWWWRWILLIAIFWTVMAPLHVGFQSYASGGLLAVEIVCDLFLIAEVVMTAFTTVETKIGLRETDLGVILRKYARGWLVPDIVSVLPIHWMARLVDGDASSIGHGWLLLRLVKVGWLLRQLSLLRVKEHFAKSGHYRLLQFMLSVMTTSHVVACLWLFIARSTDAESWMDVYLGGIVDDSDWTQYVSALHFSVTTMTSVGFGDIHANNNAEKAFVVVCMLIASTGFAFFIGNISNVLASINAESTRLQKQLSDAMAFLQFHEVPEHVRKRVIDYYEERFMSTSGTSGEDVLQDLSTPVRTDVALHMLKTLVESVPFFQGGDPNFIRSIIVNLKPTLHAPGDVIICEGDVAMDMHFIKSGSAEACSLDGRTVYKKLKAGEFFGEVALLVNTRRTASVRAITYCEVYSLDKREFQSILMDFPDSARFLKSFTQRAKYHFKPEYRESMYAGWEQLTRAVSSRSDEQHAAEASRTRHEPLGSRQPVPVMVASARASRANSREGAQLLSSRSLVLDDS